MEDKKIKIISVRISLEDYLELQNYYNPQKHKTFSDYIRYLLEVGLDINY